IWSYETIPLLGQAFAIKEKKAESIPRILRWSTDMAPLAELEIVSMMPTAEELEHQHINTMFELEKEKDETFVMKGKVFSNFGSNEKSSELEVKARLRRVEEDLASVKNEVRGCREDQKHIMAILKNCENILQNLNYGYNIKDRDDTGMGKREKETEKTIGEEKLERSDVDDREQLTSLGSDNVDKEIRKVSEKDGNVDEIKKKLEEEEQRQFIAADIEDMEEEAIYDTSPMFSTQDVAKLFGSTGYVDKVVEIAISCLGPDDGAMNEPQQQEVRMPEVDTPAAKEDNIVEDDKAIYDETPMVFKGHDKLDTGNIPTHPHIGENVALKVEEKNPHEHIGEKVDEKPIPEGEDEHDEPISTKIPKQHSKEKVKKVS
ncbi:hypothetical protein TorRG33x02_333380, partial [Trema orientale]